jgi:hypothetical protein
VNKNTGKRTMSSHDRNTFLMMIMFTGLVILNFFAVITGTADALYEPVTDLLRPILLLR